MAYNSGGGDTVKIVITTNAAAPVISYNTPNVYTVGTTITPLSPTNTGGTVVSYNVIPALPAGLTMNTNTGIISGTPTVVTSATTYSVMAYNSGGGDTVKIVITTKAIADNLPVFTGNKTISLCENSAILSINSLLTITDIDVSQTETFTIISNPKNGTITSGTTVISGTNVSPSGWSYTPTPGYNGKDSFIVQVNDGNGGLVKDTVYITTNKLPTPVISPAGNISINAGSNVTLKATATSNNYALQFNGTDWVSDNSFSLPHYDSAFTIEGWINPSSLASYCAFASRTTGNLPDPFDTYIGPDGSVSFYVGSSAIGSLASVSTQSGLITTNNWYHLAFVRTYANTTGDSILIYINGVKVVGASQPANIINVKSTEFRIGSRMDGATNAHGTIDEVKVWNRRLSDAEVLASYNKASISNTKLFAYYRFNEGTGTTTVNAVTGLSTGILVNYPTWVTGINDISYLWNPGGSVADSIVVGTGGLYTVQATSTTTGCIDTVSKYVTVINNSLYSITGNILAPSATIFKPVSGAIVSLIGTNTVNTNSTVGVYGFSNFATGNYKLKASKNNDVNKTNGVTSLDIALVQSHILGKSPLKSPYKIIAADVNGDGKVTALDIVYMKRLILAIDTTFTYGTAKDKRLWSFVDSSYKFPDTTNPFPYKDSLMYTSLNASQTNQTFIGCKLGDVNWDWNTAIPKQSASTMNALELSYSSNNIHAKGEYISIPVKVKNFKDMLGMQFTISFNAEVLQWQGLGNNPMNIEMGTNHATEGSVTFLWVDPKNEIKTLEDGSVLMELLFTRKGDCTNEQLDLNSSLTAIVAYDKNYTVHDITMNPSLINIKDIVKDVWTVAPNPVTNGLVQVQMNLKDNKTLVLRLIDNTGRLLMVKQVEGLKGNNNFTFPVENGTPSGVYYLQAKGLEGEDVKKIIIN